MTTLPPVLVVVRSRHVNAIAQQRLQALPVCHSGTGVVGSTQPYANAYSQPPTRGTNLCCLGDEVCKLGSR